MKYFSSKLIAHLVSFIFLMAISFTSFSHEFNNNFIPYFFAQQMNKSQAAAKAQSQYGGKVLSVQKQGRGSFKVKLLLESGRVKIVTIRSDENS